MPPEGSPERSVQSVTSCLSSFFRHRPEIPENLRRKYRNPKDVALSHVEEVLQGVRYCVHILDRVLKLYGRRICSHVGGKTFLVAVYFPECFQQI